MRLLDFPTPRRVGRPSGRGPEKIRAIHSRPLDAKSILCHVNVINIDMRQAPGGEEAMSEVVARIDDFGRPAWIALMVIGFIVFWPIGLAILAYLHMERTDGMRIGHYGDMQQWREATAVSRPRGGSASASAGSGACSTGRGHRGHGLRPSGNRAFDEYREEALRRLEEEANEFRDFLERLRMAKDRAEFDEFMRERRNRQAGSRPDDRPRPQPQS